MKQIAIVICNYNGGMDTVHCIEAVMKNTWKDIDIYVVDNASEDNSVALIENSFGDKVTILHNEENLGGSGGFGRGMRHAVDQGYEYVMLLDNDAFIDTDTIEKLYVYIRAHKEIGIVGAKIMRCCNGTSSMTVPSGTAEWTLRKHRSRLSAIMWRQRQR